MICNAHISQSVTMTDIFSKSMPLSSIFSKSAGWVDIARVRNETILKDLVLWSSWQAQLLKIKLQIVVGRHLVSLQKWLLMRFDAKHCLAQLSPAVLKMRMKMQIILTFLKLKRRTVKRMSTYWTTQAKYQLTAAFNPKPLHLRFSHMQWIGSPRKRTRGPRSQ